MTNPKDKFMILIGLFFLAIICTANTASSTQQENGFVPSWSFYNKKTNFTLSNGINTNNIVFSVWAQDINTTLFQITQDGFWKSTYVTKYAKINVVGHGQNLLAKITWNHENMLNLSVYQQNRSTSTAKIYVLYDQPLRGQENIFTTINGCDQFKRGLDCSFNFSKSIEIQFDPTGINGTNIAKMRQIMDQSVEINIDPLLKKFNINPDSTQYTRNFAKDMLQSTLDSLCSQTISYYSDRYFGLCSSSNPKQIDLHYSLLVIDILFNYNPEMAAWLTQNFLDLLQEKLFYDFEENQWIPIPEHIEVFVTYIRYIQKSKTFTETQIRKKINKVVQIQNGLINNLLLSEVNHLSEELNYRENNKIHPTIMKMLTQAWKTDSPRARVSSIYAESFTNDFYYHQQNEKLDTSVGKMMWLLKLINQHLMVVKSWGDSFQKQSMQQLVSLVKVMQSFVLEDERAKNGDFHSIIEAQNLRLYTRSVGYESLLPFAYEISPVFPTTSMLNLTTVAGLASMPLAHQKAKQSYNFRGNINLYFNFKILFNMIQRCETNPKFRVFYPGLRTVVEQIQRAIIATYAESNNEESPKFYTSWTAKGKGISTEKHLGILTLAFMQELKQVSPNGSAKQNKIRQQKRASTE